VVNAEGNPLSRQSDRFFKRHLKKAVRTLGSVVPEEISRYFSEEKNLEELFTRGSKAV